MKRRIIYMVLVFVLLVGGGSVGWQYLANQVDERLSSRVQRLADQGKLLECDNQRVEGYPFRVGIFCDRILYQDLPANTSFKSGEFRSAAQFYQPEFVVGELDGPAVFTSPDTGDLVFDWKLARTSSRISLEGIKRVSLKLEDFTATTANDNYLDLIKADLSQMEIHLRPGNNDTGSPDLEAAIDIAGIRIDNFLGAKLPRLGFKADGVLAELNAVLKSGQDVGSWIRSNGLAVQLHHLQIKLESGGILVASGPLRVDRSGLISGKLDLEVTDIQTVVETIAGHFPQLGDGARTISQISAIFAGSTSDGKMRLQVQISQGRISAGFFPLGFIPRIF